MNQTDIILLSGPQGSGKSTIQNALGATARRIGYEMIQQYNFADPLYEFHNYILNRIELYTGVKRVEKDGVLLQQLGTEWGRKVRGDNIWCSLLDKKVQALDKYNGRKLVIVGDCRFESEFNYFPKALKVRLVCPEAVRKERTTGWRENTQHKSEIDLDQYAADLKFDLYLNTSFDGPGLDGCLELIMAKLQKRWTPKSVQL